MQNTQGLPVRSLSGNEARFISRLEFERQSRVEIHDVMRILDCSYSYAAYILHSLAGKGWLVRIRKGLYQLVPAASGGYPRRDWFVLLQAFSGDYYLSFLSAAYLHRLSPQRPLMAQIATPKLVRAQYATRKQGIDQVVIGASRFFGFNTKEEEGLAINVAEPAKSVVDCLHRPDKAGGILEAARVVARGFTRGKDHKIVQYALRMRNRALVQRLGYLADVLDLEVARGDRERLLRAASAKRQHVFLGYPSVFGRRGEYDRTWGVTDNVGREHLRLELEF